MGNWLLEFAESTSTGHLAEVAEGSGAAIKWLQDRYMKASLQLVDVVGLSVKPIFEYPGADNSYYEIFRTVISTLLGQGRWLFGPKCNYSRVLQPSFLPCPVGRERSRKRSITLTKLDFFSLFPFFF